MSIEYKVAQAEKLIAEVKAELAEKASKARNWPEKARRLEQGTTERGRGEDE